MYPIRTFFAGSRHHVMNRGTRHEVIFEDDACYAMFIALLAVVPTRFPVRIHAYALMPNHYHLLVECIEPVLASALQWLQSEYARWLNARRHHRGPVWQRRYLDLLVETEDYWRYLLVYLHLNPVKAHLASHVDEGRWTSHAAYSGRAEVPSWLTVDELLGLFGAVDVYRDYLDDIVAGRRAPPAEFEVRGLWSRPSKSVAGDIEEALDVVASVIGIEKRALTAGGDDAVNIARWIALDWIPREVGCSPTAAARRLGLHPRHMARCRRSLDRVRSVDSRVSTWLEDLERRSRR